jgi:hypothetical protein
MHFAKRSANSSSVCDGGGGGGALRSFWTVLIFLSSSRDVSVAISSQRAAR